MGSGVAASSAAMQLVSMMHWESMQCIMMHWESMQCIMRTNCIATLQLESIRCIMISY